MADEPSKVESEFISELRKKKLRPEEVSKLVDKLKTVDKHKYAPVTVDFPDNHVKFAVFGDPHMGHKNYRPDILDKMVKDGRRQGVEFYCNAGDTIEGMSGRDGHIYELDYVGATAQMDYFAEEFKKFRGKPVYSIEADGSHGGWFKSKGNMGLDIGPELDARSKDYKFIGYDEQDLRLDNGLVVRLRHPGGGTAYALCFDDKTEILTEDGWKLFKDLKKEKVATLNLKKDEFEWQTPTEYTTEDYNGDLLHFSARSFDLLVTPNHRMLVRRYAENLKNGWKKNLLFPQKSHRRISFDWVIKQAEELKDAKRQEWQMKRNVSNWTGTITEKIFIPERKVKKFGKKQSPRIESINIDDMAEFIGWYVTEGYIREALISIAQYKSVNPSNYEEILDMFKRIGMFPKEQKIQQHINVYSIELAEWLVSNCGSGSKNKYLPKWLKNQPKEILQTLFDTMIKGDGWINGKGFGYKSISKRLLDDMSEISLKLGYAVTTYKDSISITKEQVLPTINSKPKIINYKGKIYCVSVPNSIIMVRRNGKAIWSGNSYKMQKYIESISSGKKPNVLLEGHFHKSQQMFYRNVFGFDVGALQEQSPFMKKIGTPAHLGYWILDVNMHKGKEKGVERVNSQFVPFYE